MFLLIIATGGIAALANTVFPSNSLLEGIINDFNPNSHILLKLRTIHPILVTILMIPMTLIIAQLFRNSDTKQYASWTVSTLSLVFLAGIITLFSLSPVYMKLTHLVLAHIAWAAIVSYDAFS